LITPVILWTMLKPLFLKLQQLKPLKEQLRKFKYNTVLFNKMLREQPKYGLPDKEWCIVLGNSKANNTVTMVSSPYCPPCSKMHKLLDEWLNTNPDVQARIIFSVQNVDNDQNSKVGRHLMALDKSSDSATVKKALRDWYEQKQKNYEAWANIYPVELTEAEFYKIDKQKAWCQMAKVTATPTLLLNGYRLPNLYQLQDLKYMLE
jgi:protein-disulfide isomerase